MLFFWTFYSSKDGCTKILSSPIVLNFDDNKKNIYNIVNISNRNL